MPIDIFPNGQKPNEQSAYIDAEGPTGSTVKTFPSGFDFSTSAFGRWTTIKTQICIIAFVLFIFPCVFFISDYFI